jgi:FAD/FMN-containing dehydrogenase
MVVRPASTEQVSEVVSVCASRGAAITTQGGNTGLVGGGVPGSDGAVVLSTQRLRRLDAVDHSSRRVVAGAGTTIAGLHRHAAAEISKSMTS